MSVHEGERALQGPSDDAFGHWRFPNQDALATRRSANILDSTKHLSPTDQHHHQDSFPNGGEGDVVETQQASECSLWLNSCRILAFKNSSVSTGVCASKVLSHTIIDYESTFFLKKKDVQTNFLFCFVCGHSGFKTKESVVWRFRNFSFYPSIASTGLVRAYDSLETKNDSKKKGERKKIGRRKKKIGERNLEQLVDWRRLKKFRENWRKLEKEI